MEVLAVLNSFLSVSHLFLSFLSRLASVCLRCGVAGPPSAPGLPDSHLLFSCCPAEGSSRRAVPSGEPRASAPNKASRVVGLCTPPLALAHNHTEVHSNRPSYACGAHTFAGYPEGRSYWSRHPLFLFIRVVIHLSLLFYSFAHRRVGGEGFFRDNAEDVE